MLIMLKFQIALLAILIACVTFISCERIQQVVMPPEAADDDTMDGMMPEPILHEVLASYKSWKYEQPLPAPPATFTEAKDSGSAHGLGNRSVYIDGLDHQFFYAVPSMIDAGTPVIYPAGLTLVKEIMDDTNTFVWRVAIMQKTEDPMYADHNGWMYVQYQRDSEMDAFVAKAGDGTEKGSMGCHGCHAKAAHDSVFVTELLLELGRSRLEALQSGQTGTDTVDTAGDSDAAMTDDGADDAPEN